MFTLGAFIRYLRYAKEDKKALGLMPAVDENDEDSAIYDGTTATEDDAEDDEFNSTQSPRTFGSSWKAGRPGAGGKMRTRGQHESGNTPKADAGSGHVKWTTCVQGCYSRNASIVCFRDACLTREACDIDTVACSYGCPSINM